jgi:hypothetical protein
MYKTDCYEMHAVSGGGRTVEAKMTERLQSTGLEIFSNTIQYFSVVYESFIYIYKLY